MKKITLVLLTFFLFTKLGNSQTASCLNFDGVNDFCIRPIISTQVSSLTIEARVNMTGTSTANQFLFYNGNSGSSGYGVFIPANTNSLTILYGGLGTVNTGIALSNSTWNLFSFIFGNNTFTVYVNGINTFTYNAGVNPSTPSGSFAIGSNQVGAENFYGSIDDFRFWNRLVCSSEISYRASCQLSGSEPGLVAYYNFNQGIAASSNSTVTTLVDLTANSNACALTNFSLTGSTSNWINSLGVLNTSCAAIVPLTVTLTTAASLSICAGAAVTLSVSSGLNTYTWNTNANTASISISPTILSTYSVIGTNTSNGCYAMAQQTVNIYTVPTVSISSASNTLCSSISATITSTVTGAATYTWSTGTQNTSSIVVTPTATTVYSINATAPASVGACLSNSTFTMNYVITPTVTVASTPTGICTGTSAVLSASGATTYSWNTTATTSSITVSPTAPSVSVTTVYTVTGYNGACLNTKTVAVVTYPSPTISVASNTACANRGYTLTASGASTYTWNTSATGSVLTFTPSANVSYTVNGTSAFGCVASATAATITTVVSPTITTLSNSSPTICSGNTATLTAVASPTCNYTWTGPTSVTNGQAFFPTVSGTYSVVATASNGCTDIGTTSMTVVTTPGLPPTSSPGFLCFGQTATITATGAANYTWLPSNTNNSFIVVNPGSTTTYTVIKSNSNCVDTKIFTLTVVGLPTLAIFPSSSSVCANNTIILNANGGTNYTWAPTPGNQYSIMVTPTALTVYTLIGTNGTCTTSVTQTITPLGNPTIGLSVPSLTLCKGFCTTITATGAQSYTWSATPNNTNAVLSGTSSIDCPTISTTYSVSGTNAAGCKTGSTIPITVYQVPVFNVTASNPVVCTNSVSILSVPPQAGASYSWSVGGYTTRTVQVTVIASSVYSITETFTSTGCKTTNTVGVAVFSPTFSITGPTAVCVGGTINLVATGANTYNWLVPGGNPFTFATYPVSPSVQTVYYCTATSSTLGGAVSCSVTNSYLVGIYLNPTITAVMGGTFSGLPCKGSAVKLVGGGAATYTWSDFQTGSTVTIYPLDNSLVYTVNAMDANGCPGTATVLVRTSFCTGLEKNTLDLPTLKVYPNPSNGEFVIQCDQQMNLNIIDELGRIVRSISITEINNNQSRIKGLSSGVYFIVGERDKLKVHQKIIVNN